MAAEVKSGSDTRKKLIKLNVITAVEETSGRSPERMLEEARRVPDKPTRKVFIVDYIPAFEAIFSKGYTQGESAKMLVAMGCPFSARSITGVYMALQRKKMKR